MRQNPRPDLMILRLAHALPIVLFFVVLTLEALKLPGEFLHHAKSHHAAVVFNPIGSPFDILMGIARPGSHIAKPFSFKFTGLLSLF
jgi:hypothetical protein